ncbi:MAG: hypothetical protein Ct9H300mP7_3040 [Verrucomicrobiota bacterium]|nr:MAG: hypothetical protein Ct9H300mP7_3040 [Verrucomicrobiota bacterium]
MQRCSACHKCSTRAARLDRTLPIISGTISTHFCRAFLDPSREIREGFEHMQVRTRDGRLLSGFLTDRTARLLILRGIDGRDVVIEQSQVKSPKVNSRSLMPEGLLSGFSDQQLRDFFPLPAHWPADPELRLIPSEMYL